MAGIGNVTPFINTGNNLMIRIVDVSGNIVLPNTKVISFEDTPERQKIKVAPINSGGIVFNYDLPEGHMGKITFAREDDTIDALQATVEGLYYAGLPPQLYSIYLIIQNMGGTIDEYLLSNCNIWVSNMGDWTKDKEVTETLEYCAQLWQIVS